MLAPAGSDRISPDSPSSTGSSPEEDLSSTTHRSAGRWVERCTVRGVPFPRSAGSAAFMVPLVLTTRVSPARRNSGRSLNLEWTMRSSSR